MEIWIRFLVISNLVILCALLGIAAIDTLIDSFTNYEIIHEWAVRAAYTDTILEIILIAIWIIINIYKTVF